jgi:hypothetical protein
MSEKLSNLRDSYGIPEKRGQFCFIPHQIPSQGWCKERREEEKEEEKKEIVGD